MALSGTIALSASSTLAEQQVAVTLTITNPGGSAILVTSIQPTVVPTGLTGQTCSVAVGTPPVGGVFPSSVPPSSGTLLVTWPITPHAPASGYGLSEPSPFSYSVGATFYANDGSITVATPATLSVANPGH